MAVFDCPCGAVYETERSLRSHKKGCDLAVRLPVGGRNCVCGLRILTSEFMSHRKDCPGPKDPDSIVLTHAQPPNEITCVCGKKRGSRHINFCSQWWVYQRHLPVKCEGCGFGFLDTKEKGGHAKDCELWVQWRQDKDASEKTNPCPACGKLMKGTIFGLHTSSCTGGFTESDWESWRSQMALEKKMAHLSHFPEGGEGQEFLTCKLCGLRFHQLAEHLVKAHNTTAKKYRAATGGLTKSESMKEKTRDTLLSRYGVDHPAKLSDHWKKSVATFVRRYGVLHPRLFVPFIEKARNTCRAKYGVDHPLQSREVQERIKATCGVTYGSDHYFSSDAFKAWSMEKYGSEHPMGNKDFVFDLLQKISASNNKPNNLETRVLNLAPSLIYTGNWSWWRYLPLIGGHKNPDFLVPGPDPQSPRSGVTKVVEVFGDYWHSEKLTGKSPFDHERELIEAYADIGISCLVLWESDVKRNPEGVRQRLMDFLGASSGNPPMSHEPL